MQVVMLADVFDANRVLLAKGTTQDLAEAVARDLIGTARARWASDPVPSPTQMPGTVYATPAQVAASVPFVAAGVQLADPVTRIVYGQSDGAGGYQPMGSGGADLDYTEVNVTAMAAAVGKAYESKHANGCAFTLGAGAAKNSVVGALVQKLSNGGPVSFVAGAGATLVSNGPPQVASEGVLMLAVRTATADQWMVIGNEAGPVYIGEWATWDEFHASAFANGTLACFALPQNSWVSIREFIAGTGRGGILYRSFAATQADAHWTSPHELVLYQGALVTGNDVVYPANVAVVSVASASAGAKTRVQMTGHGLTAASNGVGIAVTAGTNWTPGRYAMTYVDADNFDLDVAWNAAFGLPTITKATGGTQITDLLTVTPPAGMRQKTSVTVAEAQFETSTISANKWTQVKHGGVQIHNGQIDTVNAGESVRINMRNCNSKAAQVQQATSISASYTKTGAPSRTAVDTSLAQAIAFGIDLPTANVWARIAGATVSVRI